MKTRIKTITIGNETKYYAQIKNSFLGWYYLYENKKRLFGERILCHKDRWMADEFLDEGGARYLIQSYQEQRNLKKEYKILTPLHSER